MKRLISFLAILTFTVFSLQAQLGISLGSVSAVAETNITVPVFVDFSEADEGIGSMTIIINYDSAVLTSFLGFSDATEELPGITVLPVTGGILISWVDLDSDDTSQYAGKLLDLEFFYAGGFTQLSINTGASILTDGSGNPIPAPDIEFTNGAVQIDDEAVFSVVLASSPSGIGAVLTGAGAYHEDDEVTIKAGEVEYYSFTGWTGGALDLELLSDVASVSNTFVMPGRNVSLTARYQRVRYPLTVNIDGGGEVKYNGITYSETVLVDAGTNVALTAHPAESWEFNGWGGDASGTQTSTLLFMDEAKLVMAGFTEVLADTFLLSLIGTPADIGASLTGAGYYEAGEQVVITASQVDGYRFDGWAGSAQDIALLNDASVVTATFTMPERSVSLTAKYKRQVLLTLDIAGNGQVLVNGEVYNTPRVLDAGTNVILAAQAASGWRFDTWGADVTSNNSPYSFIINEDTSATATFVEIVGPITQYTLTITITGTSGGAVHVNGLPYTGPVTVNEGNLVALQYFTQPGWKFDGWGGDLSGTTSPAFITMNSNKNITASFSEIPEPEIFLLAIDIAGEGQVLVGNQLYTEPLLLEEGTTLTLTAMASTGWKFDGWSIDFTGTNSSFNLVMDDHKTIMATFSEIPPEQVTLSISTTGNGSVSVNGDTYTTPVTIEKGTILTLQATPDEGWQFNGWSGDHTSTSGTIDVLMSASKEITATFTLIPIPQFTLEVILSGEGSVTVNGEPYTSPVTVDEGTVLNLVAVPAEGWGFDRWNGSMQSTNPEINVTMTEDKELTAFFEELPAPSYSLTFAVRDQAGVSITGATVTLNSVAYPAGIYLFVGLNPGTFNYVVAKSGYFSTQGSVQITNSNVTVDVVLTKDNTSIEEAVTAALRVYPNPASILLTIESDKPMKEVRLLNMIGQEVKRIPANELNQLQINVSDAKGGIYFLQVFDEEGLTTRKIQISH